MARKVFAMSVASSAIGPLVAAKPRLNPRLTFLALHEKLR
jgi:hypothetical protein